MDIKAFLRALRAPFLAGSLTPVILGSAYAFTQNHFHLFYACLAGLGIGIGSRIGQLRAFLDRGAHFAPVLRFVLVDAGQRTFRVERMCYRSSVDDWLDVHQWGPIDQLAGDWIPRLGTDAFFGTV